MDSKTIPKSLGQLWVILLALAVLGSAAIIGAQFIPWDWLKEIIKEFGAAFLVAAILGLTVDQALKIQLIRDVFYASFKYVLPEEVKNEVTRLIGYRFLCIEHNMVVTIEQINRDLARVHVRLERVLKNVSYQRETIRNRFSLDEWGFSGHKSRIEKCSMEIAGETLEGEDNPEYKDKPDAISKCTPERTINKGGTVKFVSIGSEICRHNGQIFLNLGAPTVRPVVNVVVPNGFKHRCTFGVPEGKTIPSSITDTYRLDGAQFPGQHIRVRWWPEDASLFDQEGLPPDTRPLHL